MYGLFSALQKDRYICHSQDSYLSCTIGNPLKQNGVVKLQLEFDLANVNNSETFLDFKIFANTTSINLNNEVLTPRILVVERTMLALSG